MGAIILGSLASGGKVLRRSQRSTEVDGLVTITETYTIRRQDIESIEPDREHILQRLSLAQQSFLE
jgi:hypothetical protein